MTDEPISPDRRDVLRTASALVAGATLAHTLRASAQAPASPAPLSIPGFAPERIQTSGSVTINAVKGGSGPPLLLLHGAPLTLYTCAPMPQLTNLTESSMGMLRGGVAFGITALLVMLLLTADTFAQPRAAERPPSIRALEAQLAERVTYWRSRAAQCIPTDTEFTPFMSKDMTRNTFDEEREDREAENSQGQMADLQNNPLNPANPIRCEDDDTVLFAGVRCFAGDDEGCRIIRESQQANGRWWRSPRHLAIQSQEDPYKVSDLGDVAVRVARGEIPGGSGTPTIDEIVAYLDQGTTTFSHDAGYAIMAYTIRTEPGPQAFARWIGWIDQNDRCMSFCGVASGTGVPRYCESDNCYFQPSDCSKLLAIGMHVNVTIPFCTVASPMQNTIRQHLENIVRWGSFEARFQHELDTALPDSPVTREARDAATRIFSDRISEVRSMSSRIDALVASLEQNQPLIRQLNVHNELLEVNADINTEPHSAHNLAFMILMLEHLDISSPSVHQLAVDLTTSDSGNPFYEYVAYRKSRGAHMLTQILEGCPKPSTDSSAETVSEATPYRTQWMWETKIENRDLNSSMLWDCIAAAQLWTADPVKPTFGREDSLAVEIASWVIKEKEVVDTIANAFEHFAQLLAVQPEDVAAVIAAEREDVAAAIERVVRDIPVPPRPPRPPRLPRLPRLPR